MGGECNWNTSSSYVPPLAPQSPPSYLGQYMNPGQAPTQTTQASTPTTQAPTIAKQTPPDYLQQYIGYSQVSTPVNTSPSLSVNSNGSDSSNRPIVGLVVTGIVLTVGVVPSEILLILAEIELVPFAAANPYLGIPLEL